MRYSVFFLPTSLYKQSLSSPLLFSTLKFWAKNNLMTLSILNLWVKNNVLLSSKTIFVTFFSPMKDCNNSVFIIRCAIIFYVLCKITYYS